MPEEGEREALIKRKVDQPLLPAGTCVAGKGKDDDDGDGWMMTIRKGIKG